MLTRPLPNKIKNTKFSLDDGKFLFKIISKNKNSLKGKSLQECVIKPKKGLNIPNSVYNDNLQEKIYMQYLDIFLKSKIDAVGLSFVQNKKLIQKKKKIHHLFSYPKLRIVRA